MARIRLIPRDERFFDLFEKAAGVGRTGAETLMDMLNNFEKASEYRQRIADLEHEGDAIIHDVMDKLNRTFVTPLDQEDIRAIASGLDDVIDFIQASAERLVLYNVPASNQSSKDLTAVLIEATKEVQCVMGHLRDLSNRRIIVERCIEINRLENQGDHIYREALGKLFRDGDLMELIRWKEIYEQIEQAIDSCEDLADIIESVVVKHS